MARCFGTRFGQKFVGGLILLKAIVEEVKHQHHCAVMANIRKRCEVCLKFDSGHFEYTLERF